MNLNLTLDELCGLRECVEMAHNNLVRNRDTIGFGLISPTVLSKIHDIISAEIDTASKNIDTGQNNVRQFDYEVNFPGERAAGLVSYSESISICLDGGIPQDQVYDFHRFVIPMLEEWFDGAKATTKNREIK